MKIKEEHFTDYAHALKGYTHEFSHMTRPLYITALPLGQRNA